MASGEHSSVHGFLSFALESKAQRGKRKEERVKRREERVKSKEDKKVK